MNILSLFILLATNLGDFLCYWG